jgi:AP-4 complex subunit mu-1
VILELLRRIGGIIRDYCGVLSEEAVRKNCVLVYELLDEVSGNLRRLCSGHM